MPARNTTTPPTPESPARQRARREGRAAGREAAKGFVSGPATDRRVFATAVADALLTGGRIERHLARHELTALVEVATRRWDALREERS